MARLNIDELAYELIATKDMAEKHDISIKIREAAWAQGIYLASIYNFYKARGEGKFKGFTVPAMNLRALTYELAKAIFRVGKKLETSAFIIEIARSEMGYTDQSPTEYAAVCLAAAIKENFKGPVFIQGDHFQVNAKKFAKDAQKESDDLKKMITESIRAGFFNIDIDSSTLVDLSKASKLEEQKLNFEICSQMSDFIRRSQPKGITVSIGGEIGEVGKSNSSPEELDAFMLGFNGEAKKMGIKEGLAKISVQTGTSHGGVVLPDGSVAKVNLDFETLRVLSDMARKIYGMAGAVQHGASTLPAEAFHKFPEVETAEVHLATEFQNMIYENELFPKDLKENMYEWLKGNCADERKPNQTDEQFIYTARKKALGPFKKNLMSLPTKVKENIGKELEKKFEFLFKQLNVSKTSELVSKYTFPAEVGLEKQIKQHAPVKHFEGDD